MTKTVQVLGHAFDCLPGHVTIAGRGEGHNVRVATTRAIDNMFDDQRLYRKQVGEFRLSVVVISEKEHAATVPGG